MGYGAFVPHKDAVQHLQDSPSLVGEAALIIRTDGSDFHHKPYRMPFYGFAIGFADGGNRTLIGFEGYVNAFGALPLYKHKNPVLIKSGLGLGYVQKSYDKIDNPKQNAIGSHFNINFLFRFEKTFEIQNDGGITTGVGISHYSNGCFQRPNFGLNYFHIYLGKRFKLQQWVPMSDTIPVITILPYSPKKIELGLNTGLIGYNELSQSLSDKYLVLHGSAHYIRQFSIKHAWSNGIDIYYNGALSRTESKPIQIGLSTLYIMNFDRFKIVTGLGAYLLGKPQVSKGFYSTIGLQYYLNKNWFLKFNIKTHRATADFFTVGFGFTL